MTSVSNLNIKTLESMSASIQIPYLKISDQKDQLAFSFLLNASD